MKRCHLKTERGNCGNLLRSEEEQKRGYCLECGMNDARQITLLSVPIPPMLEATIGYQGDANEVAFYWGCGDEAYHTDGLVTATGEWSGFLAFVQHPSVAPFLKGFDFGSSESPAKHWLILNRPKRQLFVAPEAVAQRRVRSQWRQPEENKVLVLSREQWDELVRQAHMQVKPISPEEIVQRMQQQQQLDADLTSWLNRQMPAAGLPR